MNKRYISAGEGAAFILEGAVLYARLMDKRPGEGKGAVEAWEDWCERFPGYRQFAERLQFQAFDMANLRQPT